MALVHETLAESDSLLLIVLLTTSHQLDRRARSFFIFGQRAE